MYWVLAGVAVIGVALSGNIMSDVEQAKYTVVETHGDIEIRDYMPAIVAEVEVAGERESAISQGFRLIAGYIFGDNKSTQKVAMTAPVIQQPSEKIAMTAPVIQQGDGTAWKVRFVMPASYTLESLPKPNNPLVKLIAVDERRFVVIRFSGLAGEKSLKTHTASLEGFIAEKGLHALSSPCYAFYNPPWTLPFLRHNEVMMEIEK